MASVKQFPGSKNWYACFKVPTGGVNSRGEPASRRIQRSTGSTDRGRALQLAISFERAAILVKEKRWIEQSAHRFLTEINAIAGVAVVQIQPTDKFINEWLTTKQRTAAAKTLKNISCVLGDFLEWLGARRTAPLIDITSRLIAEFRDAELAAGKAPTTVNKALSFLAQVFDEAVAQGAMEKNVARGLRLKGAKKNAQKRRPFTFEQFQQLVACTAPGQKGTHGGATDPDWQTFLIVTGYTGGRQQEVAQLTWGTVDFDQRRIGLLRTKNGGDMHWIPMHQSLYEHLRARADSRPQRTDRDFVMPNFAQSEERDLSKEFRECILPRIGIRQPYAEPSEQKGVGRKLAEYSIHSLRHSLSTWLQKAGVPEIMRMRIVGHEDEEVSRGYTHTELDDARPEMAKIPGLSKAGH